MRQNRAKIAVIILLGLVGGALQAAAQGGAAPTWKGAFRYAFDGGKTTGGSAIAVTYVLALVPGAASGGCLLSASGFQSDERIVCRATGDAKALTVTFHSYEDGRTVNKYGVAIYKPGQTLLTLERGEGNRILTTWNGLRPDLLADAANPGEYFSAIR